MNKARLWQLWLDYTKSRSQIEHDQNEENKDITGPLLKELIAAGRTWPKEGECPCCGEINEHRSECELEIWVIDFIEFVVGKGE